jgi:hypothetical protein
MQPSYPEFRSGHPFNVYLLIAIPIILLVTALFHRLNLGGVMTNLPIGFLAFYLLFSRFSSKIKIADYELKVIYFFPWNDVISLDLEDFDTIYYERGKRRPYDVLRFVNSKTDEAIEIKVNMKMFAIRRLLSFIQNEAKLQVVRTDPEQQMIW